MSGQGSMVKYQYPQFNVEVKAHYTNILNTSQNQFSVTYCTSAIYHATILFYFPKVNAFRSC
jgi:hypothetical protein